MTESLITFDNLSIGYNGQAVLSGISLSIARASFTAMLGANGSGKSTLLKTLLGLPAPVAGRIDIAASRRAGRLRLRAANHRVRSAVSADGLRRGAHGRLWPRGPGPLSRRANAISPANVCGHGCRRVCAQAVRRTFRRSKTTRAHRPRAGDEGRRAGAR